MSRTLPACHGIIGSRVFYHRLGLVSFAKPKIAMDLESEMTPFGRISNWSTVRWSLRGAGGENTKEKTA